MKSKRNKRMPKYANGLMGGLNKGFSAAGDAAALAGTLLTSDKSQLQSTRSMTTGPVMYEKMTAPTMAATKKENVSRGIGDTLNATASGAKLGLTAGGPIGAAIGGAVGLIGGGIKSIFGAKKRRREAREAQALAERTNTFNFAEAQSPMIADAYYGDQDYEETDVATYKNGKMPIRYNSKHTINIDAAKLNKYKDGKSSLGGDLRSGDLSTYMDIPQKALVYGATSISRGPGNGVYDTPSGVIDEWKVGNNKATKIAADALVDPLNLLPFSKYKSATSVGRKAVNVVNGARKVAEITDTVDDASQTIKGGKPNALVANGELIKKANGGTIQEVTAGSSPHVDDVPVNVQPKDSILSAKNVNPTTGNTFAEDGKKLSNIEKRMARNKERNTSIISETTAKLNQAYVDRSWDNLLKIQDASNNAAGRYADGKSPYNRYGASNLNDGNNAGIFGRFRNKIIEEREARENSTPYVTQDKYGRRTVTQQRNPSAQQPTTQPQTGDTPYTLPFPSLNTPQYIVPGSQGMSTRQQQQPVQQGQPAMQMPQTSQQPAYQTSNAVSTRSSAAPVAAQASTYAPDPVTNRLNNHLNFAQLEPRGVQQPNIKNIESPTPYAQRAVANFEAQQGGQGGSGNIMDGLSSMLTSAMDLSPVISNLIRGSKPEDQVTPEQLYSGNPYEALIASKASKMRYNSKPEEREARESEQRARYNTRQVNSAGGVNRAFDIATALNTRRATGDIQAKKQNINNQYQQHAMNLMNQMGAQRSAGMTQAKQMALDINMRNKAAGANTKALALNQLSQYSQNQTQMKSQQKRDARLEKIYEAWAKQYMPANLI